MKYEIQPQENGASFTKIVDEIETICQRNNLNHRFVGGILSDLLDLATIQSAKIDPINKTLFLPHHLKPTLIRADGTIKDFDMITFSADQNAHRVTRENIAGRERQAEKMNDPYPFASLEPTRYPAQGNRNRFTQLVSSLDVDANNQLYLSFDAISQPISWDSVEAWKVILNNGTFFTTLNPYAHALRYFMRTPAGVKRKDKELMLTPIGHTNKIHLLMSLASRVKKEALKHGIDYRSKEYYEPWKEFILALLKLQNTRVKIKGFILKKYWDGPGTALAHGKGILKPFRKLGDKFSG